MTYDALAPLPEFDSPPVVETVLSVQFDKLKMLRSVHIGLLWDRMRKQFPIPEEHPSIEPVFEREATAEQTGTRLRFELQDARLPQRFWFVNEPGTELVQVQNDRFIKNWRKRAETEGYPRYEPVIKPAFVRDFSLFKRFVGEMGLGEVAVNQCEVTYVNHIVAGDGWSDFSEIDKIFTFCRNFPDEMHPGRTEDLVLHSRFPIHSDAGEFIGRLHLDIQPAFRLTDGRPMYVMNLTARGFAGNDFDFFDIGRRAIVTSFVALTTSGMHSVWKRR